MGKIILVLSLINVFLFGQSYNMNINLKNGTRLEFQIDEIRKLTFESSTSIKQLEDLKGIVESFKVMQNYPNPFNPSTTITYQIPRTSYVKVRIFDLNGSLIKELFNGSQNEGEYKIAWDGKNLNNNKVSSGVYVYTINCDEQIISKQMILLK